MIFKRKKEKYYIKKAEIKLIKTFLDSPYPNGTHDLGLDRCFDYYAGLCMQFLKRPPKIDHAGFDLKKEEKMKMMKFINKNKNNEDGMYMEFFLHTLSAVILVLKKYYNTAYNTYIKRYILEQRENSYTYMLNIINAIGGKSLSYNWLISDIEVYPHSDSELYKLIRNNKYLFLSTEELIKILEKNDYQWIWGVFSAIPNHYTQEDVLKYDLPFADGNYNIYKDDTFIIQHPLADIEIVAFDANAVHIVSKNDNIMKKFKQVYKNVNINYE